MHPLMRLEYGPKSGAIPGVLFLAPSLFGNGNLPENIVKNTVERTANYSFSSISIDYKIVILF